MASREGVGGDDRLLAVVASARSWVDGWEWERFDSLCLSAWAPSQAAYVTQQPASFVRIFVIICSILGRLLIFLVVFFFTTMSENIRTVL